MTARMGNRGGVVSIADAEHGAEVGKDVGHGLDMPFIAECFRGPEMFGDIVYVQYSVHNGSPLRACRVRSMPQRVSRPLE